METRRTHLLRLAAGIGVTACGAARARPAEGAAYVGVETWATSGQSRAAFFAPGGARLGTTPLDFRAHGMARHGRRLVVFPRRPGTRFAVVDLKTLAILTVVDAPPGRHFYGHGAFSRDGATLLVTENDLETLQGAVGVYEMIPRPRRLGRIALPGPGPHEIVREPQADAFLIALGGVETHPAYGRTPLNLGSFRSQTLRLDLRDDRVETMGSLPGTAGISLRHLARDGAGRVYAGGQVVDARRAEPAHVLWMLDGSDATPLVEAGARLGGYVSSVAAYGPRAVATSKESHRVLTLEAGTLVDETSLPGASAAAMGPALTAVSGFRDLTLGAGRTVPPDAAEFDNHGLILLG